MSRFANIVSKETVKQFAQGAAQSAAMPLANFIAPTVDVASGVGYFKQYTEKNRFRIPETKRGLGGRATMLQFDAQDQTFNCTPHALDYAVDRLEQVGNDEDAVKEASVAVAEVAMLAHEKAVIDAALTAAGSGTNSNFTSSSVDPVAILDAEILTVLKAAKYGSAMGIRVVFGATAFSRFRNNANVRGRFVAGTQAKGAAPGIVTPQISDVGSLLLGGPKAEVSFMVYDNAAEGLAESIQFMLDTAILIFACKDTPTRRDPSFMKTFRLMGNWMVPKSYVRDDNRVDVLGFDWSEDIKVTNSAAVSRINATNS